MSSRVTRPLLSSEVKNRPRSYPPLFIGERVKQRRTFLTFLPLAFVPWELCVCVCARPLKVRQLVSPIRYHPYVFVCSFDSLFEFFFFVC